MESPVLAILKLGTGNGQVQGARGICHRAAHGLSCDDSEHYSMKWDGEWHITYEVFRDLGIAFAAVLILIYALVVEWFQSL